ncbi:MAG: cytochrome c oxidase subunit 3 [Bacteroidota bacterium]
MTSDIQPKRYIVHPQKFALWLFILTVVMIFAGLTSAYIVHRGSLAETDRLVFDLPTVLWNNLALILVSSVTMQFAVWSLKKEERTRALLGLGMTFVLGILFLFGQWAAFQAMVESNLFFVDNERIDDSVSYFYIITGLHGLHIFAGLIVLLSSLILVITERLGHRRDILTLEMASIFWHFLGLLWVYLFVFLKYTQN